MRVLTLYYFSFSFCAVESIQGALCTCQTNKQRIQIQREGVSEISQLCHRKGEETIATGLPLQKWQWSIWHGWFFQDKFSIVKLYKHIQKHNILSKESCIEVGRFFCRRASNKEMKVCSIIILFHYIQLLMYVFLVVKRSRTNTYSEIASQWHLEFRLLHYQDEGVGCLVWLQEPSSVHGSREKSWGDFEFDKFEREGFSQGIQSGIEAWFCHYSSWICGSRWGSAQQETAGAGRAAREW